MHSYIHIITLHFQVIVQETNWGPFQHQISASTTKLTSLHPYHIRNNQKRIMDHFEQNQAALRRDMDVMGDRMTQLMETLHALVQGHDELRKSTASLVKDVPATSTDGGTKPKDILVDGVPKLVDDHH